MIIKLNKAVLHLCNTVEGVNVISEGELDVTDSSINSYISAHIEKALNSASLNKGNFNNNSGLKSALIEYKKGNRSMIALSSLIAQKMYEALSCSDKMQNTDVIVAEFVSNQDTYIGILKLDSKKEYMHKILHNNGKINATMENNGGIMPSGSQSLNEYAFIKMSDMSINYASKLHSIEGERTDVMADIILECICEAKSSKEVDKTVKKLIKQISDDVLDSSVKLKTEMMRTIQNQSKSETMVYNLETIAESIFERPHLKNEFLEGVKKAGIITDADEKLAVDDYTIKKANESIKIVTDNGCEIKFPSYLYKQNNGIEIEEDGNGYKIIKIKGVQEIEVK